MGRAYIGFKPMSFRRLVALPKQTSVLSHFFYERYRQGEGCQKPQVKAMMARLAINEVFCKFHDLSFMTGPKKAVWLEQIVLEGTRKKTF